MSNHTKACSFQGCELRARSRGLCDGHHQQSYKRGVPLTPLGARSKTAGMNAQERFEYYTDKSGTCHVWTGTLNGSGYGILSYDGRRVRAHRYAFEKANGALSRGMHVDHKCHNRACVNPAHLRAVTHRQNEENRKSHNAGNRSGYRNVYFFKRDQNWHVQVTSNRIKYHVGYFDDVHEAGAAAKAKRMELFTHSDGR